MPYEQGQAMGDRAPTRHHPIQPTTRSTGLTSDVVCVFCDEVIRETSSCMMTSCGHPVCSSCLDELSNGASKCPIDQTIVNRNNVRMTSLRSEPIRPTNSQREILFRCPNKDKCDQLLPMDLLQEHLLKCLHSGQSKPNPQPTSIVHAVGPASNYKGKGVDGGEMDLNNGLVKMRPRPAGDSSKRRPLSMTSTDMLAMASVGEQRQHIEFLRDSLLTVELRVDRLLQVVKDGMMGLQESTNTVKTQLSGRIEELDKQMKEFADQISFINKRIADTVEIKKSLCVEESVSYDGVLVWKVENYSHLKMLSMNQSADELCSPPFYSSHYGYKMCLVLDVMGDGTGRGSHVSIYLSLMKGKYDDVLNWPFQQKVTFMLLDQRETRDKGHIIRMLMPDHTWSECSRPKTEKNVGRGFHRFVSHDIIESPDNCYLKNDCIYIKAVVDDSIIL